MSRSSRDRVSFSTRDKLALLSEERLSQYIRPEAILDISVDSKEELLRALSEAVVPDATPQLVDEIYEQALEREAAVNTYVGNGVAIPHARVQGLEGFALALARNPTGFPYGIDSQEPVVLVVLVVGNEKLQSEHVHLLGAIASFLVDPERRDRILATPDPAAVIRLLDTRRAPRRKARPLTQLLMSHAQKIAREMGVTAILVSLESSEELTILKRLPRRNLFIVATSSLQLAELAEKVVDRVLILPKVPLSQGAAIRLSALMALTHGLIQKGDVVAFLSGADGLGLDTMTIVEIGRQFGRFVTATGEIVPGIAPEVLERVITLAAELGAEGREGKPVGTIFVVTAKMEEIADLVQQMVMNPFRGYPEDERNILDPTLTETIKEFACIDGAFVVRGDGIVLSAGTFLKVDEDVELPGGYGSRHRAAAGITKKANCVAVALSQSTGEVRFFKSGAEVLVLQRGMNG